MRGAGVFGTGFLPGRDCSLWSLRSHPPPATETSRSAGRDVAEPAHPHSRARANVKVGALPFSDTVGSGEGAPHPCGHLACTKLTFVVKLLRLLVLANRTHLLWISPSPPEWP